jgi:hypothetical protein
MKRISPAGAILKVGLLKWERDHWRVHWHMQPDRHDIKKLAEIDEDDRVVHMYPHPTNIAPEQTGLHELLHLVFGLDGAKDNEDIVYYLEAWAWKSLNRKQRALLHDVFVAPLRAGG